MNRNCKNPVCPKLTIQADRYCSKRCEKEHDKPVYKCKFCGNDLPRNRKYLDGVDYYCDFVCQSAELICDEANNKEARQ